MTGHLPLSFVPLFIKSDASRHVISIYERNASYWNNERNRPLFEKEWLDAFLNLVPSQATVLDLGCGSGQPIADYLIELGRNVTGVTPHLT